MSLRLWEKWFVALFIYLFLAEVFERALNTEVPNPCSWSELNANGNSPLVFLSSQFLPCECSVTQLCLTPLSLGFPKQESWSGLLFLPSGTSVHLSETEDLSSFHFFFWVSVSNLILLTTVLHFWDIYIYIFFPKTLLNYWIFWEKETCLFNGTLSTFNGVILPHTCMPLKASLNRAVNPGTSQSFSSSFNSYG